MPSRLSVFFRSRLFLLVFGLAVFFIGFNYGRAWYQDYQIKEEIRRLEDEAERLEAKKMESLEVLKYVQSEDFAEAKARTELNLMGEGESAAIVKLPVLKTSGQEKKEVIEWNGISNPVKWWRYFWEGRN